ncbi:MAG: nitrous oxide reductase accessory protein NosL [Chitinophagales bacterium]|nr:nitrous oxide reductase accessory protein NosL [Chitinophagales bacterium]
MRDVIKFSLLFLMIILLSACTPRPHEIHFDEEDCDYCMMTISDRRFGAEIVTQKGRVYKFDDLHCLKGFMDEKKVEEKDIHSTWVIDFSVSEKLIQIENSFLFYDKDLQSPMGSNVAAFGVKDSLESYRTIHNLGIEMEWEEFLRSK